jgi:uncharacterized protein YycO
MVLLAIVNGQPDEVKVVHVNEKTRWKLAAQKFSDGDLIFRKGRDLVSDLILTQGQSARFSHVGMIVKQGDLLYVAHALPEDSDGISGVQIEPVEVFASIENAVDIAVYRFKGINDTIRGKLKQFVLQQIGKPFDQEFLMSTDEKLYCSELIIKSFAMAGIQLVDKIEPIKIMMIKESVFLPDHLRQSPQLRSLALEAS